MTSNHTRSLGRFAVAAVAAAAVLVPAGTAFAQSTPGPSADAVNPATTTSRLDVARARCTSAIDRRLSDLTRLQARTTASAVLTAEHRAAITSTASATTAGLQALRVQVQAAADLATLRPLCQSVVRDWRVYALRMPQAALTTDLDREAANVTRLTAVADQLQARIDAAKAAGRTTAAAEAHLASMRRQLATAASTLAGKADALLAITPAQYNANTAVLAPYRADVRTARAALGQATRSAVKVRLGLRRAR